MPSSCVWLENRVLMLTYTKLHWHLYTLTQLTSPWLPVSPLAGAVDHLSSAHQTHVKYTCSLSRPFFTAKTLLFQHLVWVLFRKLVENMAISEQKRLFIGNLPPDIKDNELKQEFSYYGKHQLWQQKCLHSKWYIKFYLQEPWIKLKSNRKKAPILMKCKTHSLL